MKLLLCVTVLLVSVEYSFGANILGVVPTPSFSHQVVFWPLWTELSLRGHKVTVITTDPMNNAKLQNLTEIDLHSAYQLFNYSIFQVNERTTLELIYGHNEFFSNILDHMLTKDEVQHIIKDETTHFDVVMVEGFHTAAFAFASRFKCPLILLSSFDASSFAYREIGNPAHPVLHPDAMLPFSNILTFTQRLASCGHILLTKFTHKYLFLPTQQKLVEKHFGTGYPMIEDIFKNYSMFFVNTNHFFHPIKPLLPNIIQIGGGTHLQKPTFLPENLQNVLDNAKNGVIYFSLGSNVKSKDLFDDTRLEILETFKELPYTVLWKFENENLPNISKNVIISKWFPQQDVLRHPNVKLFITQGGLQSLEEAIFSHVPIIGIPVMIMSDQTSNIANIVSKGLGLSLDYKNIRKEDFKSAILTVIQNPRYRNKVKEIAALIQDQPETGLHRAVWWTEYVIRHGGAPHMRNPGIDFPWYQYYLLDIIGFVLLISMVVIFVIVALWKITVKMSRVIRLKLRKSFVYNLLFAYVVT
ncbi:hypothetical protein RI129_000399 [Pyrocoelia pectoralis]|uniref:UDP-glucuronosyltransferase n=1 Tax=Pyrocoelia pectoralis TaxID=417401 RepID=A0AAN7ZJA2_9COLE